MTLLFTKLLISSCVFSAFAVHTGESVGVNDTQGDVSNDPFPDGCVSEASIAMLFHADGRNCFDRDERTEPDESLVQAVFTIFHARPGFSSFQDLFNAALLFIAHADEEWFKSSTLRPAISRRSTKGDLINLQCWLSDQLQNVEYWDDLYHKRVFNGVLTAVRQCNIFQQVGESEIARKALQQAHRYQHLADQWEQRFRMLTRVIKNLSNERAGEFASVILGKSTDGNILLELKRYADAQGDLSREMGMLVDDYFEACTLFMRSKYGYDNPDFDFSALDGQVKEFVEALYHKNAHQVRQLLEDNPALLHLQLSLRFEPAVTSVKLSPPARNQRYSCSSMERLGDVLDRVSEGGQFLYDGLQGRVRKLAHARIIAHKNGDHDEYIGLLREAFKDLSSDEVEDLWFERVKYEYFSTNPIVHFGPHDPANDDVSTQSIFDIILSLTFDLDVLRVILQTLRGLEHQREEFNEKVAGMIDVTCKNLSAGDDRTWAMALTQFLNLCFEVWPDIHFQNLSSFIHYGVSYAVVAGDRDLVSHLFQIVDRDGSDHHRTDIRKAGQIEIKARYGATTPTSGNLALAIRNNDINMIHLLISLGCKFDSDFRAVLDMDIPNVEKFNFIKHVLQSGAILTDQAVHDFASTPQPSDLTDENKRMKVLLCVMVVVTNQLLTVEKQTVSNIQQALQFGAVPNAKKEHLGIFDREGAMNALHYFAVAPSLNGDDPHSLEKLELLLNGGVDLHETTQNLGNSALGLACEYSSAAVVQVLLARGSDVNHVNHMGATMLHKAVRGPGALQKVQLLLDHGFHDVHAQTRVGETVFEVACKHSTAEVVQFLSDLGFDVNKIYTVPTPNGNEQITMLHQVLAGPECADKVAVLMDHGFEHADISREKTFDMLFPDEDISIGGPNPRGLPGNDGFRVASRLISAGLDLTISVVIGTPSTRDHIEYPFIFNFHRPGCKCNHCQPGRYWPHDSKTHNNSFVYYARYSEIDTIVNTNPELFADVPIPAKHRIKSAVTDISQQRKGEFQSWVDLFNMPQKLFLLDAFLHRADFNEVNSVSEWDLLE